MKANELRIGNLVFNGSVVIKVWMLAGKNVNGFDSEEEDFPFTPIPLTEECLLKFGFKKDSDNSMVKNDIAIFLDKRFRTNLFLRDNQENKWFSFNFKVKYMHQLQNIHFALTSEELKFK